MKTNNRSRYRKIDMLIFCPTLLLLCGCAASECLDNQNSRPNAVFLASGGENPGVMVKVDSLTVYGIGAPGDSMLVTYRSLSGITLPFRIGAGETRYVFRYGKSETAPRDTLTFSYESIPEFVSEACGAIYAFDDVKVKTTTWAIDSVVCPWSKINNIERDYIQIYFKTADEK